MRRNGVAGTGMNELLANSKTARRSIYQNFPRGKQQLIEESVRTAGATLTTALAGAGAGGGPAVLLAGYVRMWKEALVASDFTAGCPVVAAALAGTEVPAAPGIAGEVFTDWKTLIATHLTDAGIPPQAAASLATLAVAAIEGAVVMAIALRSVTPLDQVTHHLTELFVHHQPAAARGR